MRFAPLANPEAFRDPSTYEGRYWRGACTEVSLCSDYCGVHTNSGVPNKMFHLLAEGGTHNGVTVTGIGIRTAMLIAMGATRDYWTNSETFLSARMGMERAALVYGEAAVVAVSDAWEAVGVSPP